MTGSYLLSPARFSPIKERWLLALALLLTVCIYTPAFWAELVWDDVIISSEALPNFQTIRDAFDPPARQATGPRYYYRPVTTLSNMLDRKLFGPDAELGPHLLNVFYHLVTTFFVWLLARHLLRHLPYASIGALVAMTIFAVHPIHTESVSWISGRTDVLAAMFLIPSIVLVLHDSTRAKIWPVFPAAVSFCLALMAKEVAAAGLVLVPAALIVYRTNINHASITSGLTEQVDDSPTHRPGKRLLRKLLLWVELGVVYTGVTWFYLRLRSNAGGMDTPLVPLTGSNKRSC